MTLHPAPPLTILYVGTLNPGGTCLQRMQTLAKLGHRIVPLDLVPGRFHEVRSTFAWRVRNRLLGPTDDSHANERLLALPASPAPDLIWFDKAVTITLATLNALRARWPGVYALAYSGDDMFNPRNQSRAWLERAPHMDLHVTTKSFNVQELFAIGARDVYFTDKGYSPEVHRPHEVTPEVFERFGGEAGFVGWPEGARERSMRQLARAGVPVRVWGPWPRWKSAPNFRVEGRPLWNDDYARALSAFKINLGFLRRVNRDRQTTRSVEIPACGGFLLAERTEEHLQLFREDVEAVFFANDDDLIDKARWYLAHDAERRRIADAGRRRCLQDGYAYDTRLDRILEYVCARRAVAA